MLNVKQKRSEMILGAIAPTGYGTPATYLHYVSVTSTSNIAEFKRQKTVYRSTIVESYLTTKQLEPVFSFNVDASKEAREIGVLFLSVDRAGQLYHWKIKHGKNILSEVSKGVNSRKKTPLDLQQKLRDKIANFDAMIDRALQLAREKFTPFTVTNRPCSMLLARDLKTWHDTNRAGNLGVSCVFRQDKADRLAEIAVKFYRRAGFNCLAINQGDIIIGRCFVDKTKQFTRLYLNSKYNTKAIEKTVENAGYTKNLAYTGTGYARLSKDEGSIYAPYLDGTNQQINVGEQIRAKNGKQFIKIVFDGDEITLDQLDGCVSLSGYTCSQCDRMIDYDDMRPLYNGDPICDDCSSYCEECDETVIADDMTAYFYRTNRGDIEEGYCCQSCADCMTQVPFRG